MKIRYLALFACALFAGCANPPPSPATPPPAAPKPAPVPAPTPSGETRLAALQKYIGKPAVFRNTYTAPDDVLCGEVSIEGGTYRRFYSTGVGIVYYTGAHVANLFRSVCGK